MNRITMFDMDGTLTLPREEIGPDMIRALRDLSKVSDIGVVTGSDYDYFMQQCKFMFDMSGIPVTSVQIFPCNGTKHYTWKGNGFKKVYDADMMTLIGTEKYRSLLISVMTMQAEILENYDLPYTCLLYTSPSPRDLSTSRMPSSA